MAPIKVLVVDDSEDDRFILSWAFRKSGLPVQLFEATDGKEAMDFLSHTGRFSDLQASPQPDLLLLDLKMPGVNGFDVLQWLQQHPEAAPKQIVVLSGSEIELDMRRAEQFGVTHYLIKPPTPEQLRHLLVEQLRLAA